MVLFHYEAITPKGKKMTGEISAESYEEARLKLAKASIAAISLSLLSEKELSVALSPKEVLQFTKELARLLLAGLPLYEALIALEEKYRSVGKSHRLLLHLCDQIRKGESLSQALRLHPKSFDLLYCAMIANAEKTGSLVAALEELAFLLAKKASQKKQLLSALLYPAILSTFCLLVLSALLFFIIPSLFDLFEGRRLHPLTQSVLFLSKAACALKPYLVAFLFLLGGGGFFFLRSSQGKAFVFAKFCRFPWLKELLLKAALARFCRSFAVLLEGGLSFLEALAFSKKVLQHPLLEKEIEGIEVRVSQGASLSEEFRKSSYFPPLVSRMISIAEEGGGMAVMLKNLSQIYEEELEKTLSQMAIVLQPLLLLILGVVVGLVVLSVLLPLTDVSSFLEG